MTEEEKIHSEMPKKKTFRDFLKQTKEGYAKARDNYREYQKNRDARELERLERKAKIEKQRAKIAAFRRKQFKSNYKIKKGDFRAVRDSTIFGQAYESTPSEVLPTLSPQGKGLAPRNNYRSDMNVLPSFDATKQKNDNLMRPTNIFSGLSLFDNGTTRPKTRKHK